MYASIRNVYWCCVVWPMVCGKSICHHIRASFMTFGTNCHLTKPIQVSTDWMTSFHGSPIWFPPRLSHSPIDNFFSLSEETSSAIRWIISATCVRFVSNYEKKTEKAKALHMPFSLMKQNVLLLPFYFSRYQRFWSHGIFYPSIFTPFAILFVAINRFCAIGGNVLIWLEYRQKSFAHTVTLVLLHEQTIRITCACPLLGSAIT